MRTPGIIRCRGPTTATVSLAAKSVAWYSVFIGVS